MSDQIEIKIPRPIVEEETNFTLTAVFKNRATGALLAPTTARYRIDDLTTRRAIRDWTTLTPGTSIDITIDHDDNTIQSGSSRLERRQITVQGDAGTASQVTGTAQWRIHNVYGLGVAGSFY